MVEFYRNGKMEGADHVVPLGFNPAALDIFLLQSLKDYQITVNKERASGAGTKSTTELLNNWTPKVRRNKHGSFSL